MVTVLSSVVVWGAIAILVLRILNRSGMISGSKQPLAFALADKSQKSGFEVKKKDILYVFLLALAFRIIVFLISVLVIYMFNDSVNGIDGILEQYMKWDANNYVRIATGGYEYYRIEGDFSTIVFFPLYPWIMKCLNFIFADLRISGLVLSAVLYSGACCYLYALLSADYSKNTAKNTVVFISVFPHALFFGTIMNESMLLFTSAATLYYIRKHKWWLVGIFGALAALSRAVGIALAIPAAVEWLEEYGIFEKLKNKDMKTVRKLFYSKGAWIFLMLIGTGIYLLCNYKVTGDCFKFLEYQQKYWYHQNTYFGTGIAGLFNHLADENTVVVASIHIPSVVSIIFVLSALVYGLRRSRSMYSAYLIAYIIINMSVDWIISTPRYMACAIPVFIFLADFSERHKWSESLITASMAVGLGVYLVAYLCWKQIL